MEVSRSAATAEEPFYKHIPPSRARPLLETRGIDYSALCTFAVVRNPFNRLSSYYFWQLEQWRSQGEQPQPFKEHLCEVVPKGGVMWGSIANYLKDAQGRNALTHVLRFERLNEDFGKLAKEWPIPVEVAELPHIGASPARDIAALYDDELIALVQENYRVEFEVFGYEPTPRAA